MVLTTFSLRRPLRIGFFPILMRIECCGEKFLFFAFISNSDYLRSSKLVDICERFLRLLIKLLSTIIFNFAIEKMIRENM